MQIGAKLRKLREARSLSLKDLAERTGLSRSFISMVERDQVNVSLENLRRICQALDTPMFSLFSDDEPDALYRVERARTRKRIQGQGAQVVYERVTPGGYHKFEVLAATLAAKQWSSPEPWSHAAEEAVMVLDGRAVVEIAGERVDLREGDCVYFDSRHPHRYYNPGTKPCRLLITVTPPSY